MSSSSSWCTIESDPGIFSTMLKELGVVDAQVEELWSLDEAAYSHLKPIKAIIFLFKYDPEVIKKTHEKSEISKDTTIYFAKQIIQNACATQAIINACLNFKNENKFELGKTLEDFKSFTEDFPADTKGETLSNSVGIRKIHNSYARNTVFEIDHSLMRTKKEDPFHFVTYLPINGNLIELDGLMEGPVDHGKILNESDWVKDAKTVLVKRMELYGAGEIRFNLMAIVSDKKAQLEEQFALETEKDEFDSDLVCKLQNEIEAEEIKFDRYETENVLRKHNFLPMIVEHLKILAEYGNLVDLMEKAEIKS